jgi:hypothetical protein
MNLEQFLVRAKISTYATGGEALEKSMQDGSKAFFFEDKDSRDFTYRDRYFGFNPFAGEEVVWKGTKPIWIMNYYGAALENRKDIDPREIYKFLRIALGKVDEERPFRGPKSYEEEDLSYVNKSTGSLDKFLGYETISYKGKEVYRLEYHGGRL